MKWKCTLAINKRLSECNNIIEFLLMSLYIQNAFRVTLVHKRFASTRKHENNDYEKLCGFHIKYKNQQNSIGGKSDGPSIISYFQLGG